MTMGALLQDLAGRGVVLTAESGRLRYKAPAGAMTPNLRRQLEAHRAALLALLSAQQAGLFDGAAPSPDAGHLVPHMASQAPQDGASAPDLAETSNASRPLGARAGQDLAQDPMHAHNPMHAARLVHGDFERARQRLAALAAELEALQAAHDFRPGGPTWARFSALVPMWAALRPVAEYDSLAALETATGAAYQAVVSAPTDPAALERYRRLDDAWAAVLGLPDLPHEVPNVT